MTTATLPLGHIRWATRRDIARMVEIDAAASGDDAMAFETIEGHLLRRDEIGMVVECGDVAVGFMIYRLEADRIVLLKLAVHPNYQGHGFGSELLKKLRYKLAIHRRDALVTPVDRDWLTRDVLTLLNGQDDPPLYMLADALREAGCADEGWLTLFRDRWDSEFAKAMYAMFRDSVALKVTG